MDQRAGWSVATHYVGYLFAIGAGLVSAGLISSIWELTTSEQVNLSAMSSFDLLSPLRGLVFIFSRPTNLMFGALVNVARRPLYAVPLLLIGGTLSFLQGVVVMHYIFGIQ